jgi:hypothetical protein
MGVSRLLLPSIPVSTVNKLIQIKPTSSRIWPEASRSQWQGAGPQAGYYPVFLREFAANAAPLAAALSATPVRDRAEIEAAVSAFAREPAGGLIAAPDPFINTQRDSCR